MSELRGRMVWAGFLLEIIPKMRYRRSEFSADEFRLYEALYDGLQKLPYEQALDVVSRVYDQLVAGLDRTNWPRANG